jgi:homoserine O-succinyltransferase/O-acetyltransferase
MPASKPLVQSELPSSPAPGSAWPHRAEAIVVGLVNNMPDAALRRTDRQFRELLQHAAGNRPTALRVFSATTLPRSAAASQYVREQHCDIEQIWDADLDGMIVTGTEPKAATLLDEPGWSLLTRLADRAAERGLSTIWSCLAAHAVVQYLDGVERRPLERKLSGVFQCVRSTEHRLIAQGPTRWCTPHSRQNEIQEQDLVRRDYLILGRSNAAGADIFVKERGVLFVFLQGHPEYDADVLLREYRRDIGRYLSGTNEGYPQIPAGYLDSRARATLDRFRALALRRRNPEILCQFPMLTLPSAVAARWRGHALALYGSWLAYLAEQRMHGRPGRTGRPPRLATRLPSCV